MDVHELRNHVMALHVPGAPLTFQELDALEWRAKAMKAQIKNLPVPIRPGTRQKIAAFFRRLYSAWLDRKALTRAIGEQANRICELEDLLEENRIAVPGGRSDE